MKGQDTFQKANPGQHKVRAECGDVPSGTRQVTRCPSIPIVYPGLAGGCGDRKRTDNTVGQPVMYLLGLGNDFTSRPVNAFLL